MLEELLAVGPEAPSVPQKVEVAQAVRRMSADAGQRLDRVLFERLARMHRGIAEAQSAHEELRALLARLDTPPWSPALFLRDVETSLGPRAMVLAGGTRRVVAVTDGLDLDMLVPGEEVFLGQEGNVVAGRSPYGTPRCGETAHFDRLTADGRCVLRWRDEEIVVDAAGALDVGALRAGDQVRWDRGAWMAFERVEGGAARRFLLADAPDADRSQVGGQDESLDVIVSALTAGLVAPERAARYGLDGRATILLVGPPGCGKTLMARVAVAEVGRLGGRACRMAVVKPAEWESPWVGETQENIRRCFRMLREGDGPAVLFLDEIEAVGRTRGAAANLHGDKFLGALLAEIDGFAGSSNLAIIAATNRKELVDSALLERLSEVEIAVRRPHLEAARAILAVHLPAGAPVQAPREELIEATVSHLYAPNGEGVLATVRLRDGRTRVIGAPDLVSGRLLAQIARLACRSAFDRDEKGGAPGISVADMLGAVSRTMDRLATSLTPRSVREHVAGLPDDMDVVGVEPVTRRVTEPHRYRHAA